MTAKILISVKQLSKTYANGTVALQNTNLEVQEGELLSIVGPSGCGKSTLLRIVAGLSKQTSGEVSIAQVFARAKNIKNSIGFVFQEANLLPWRSVIANVALPLELAGVGKKERLAKAAKILNLIGLNNVFKAYPRELSGGMSMRVSIARALITEPRLLLMDEPFGALDEITRQKLGQELLELKGTTGTTIIYVTHNVFEAVYLSERILVFGSSPGKVIKEIVINEPPMRSEDFRGKEIFSQAVMKLLRRLGKASRKHQISKPCVNKLQRKKFDYAKIASFILLPVLALIIIITLWQISVITFKWPHYLVPSPKHVIAAFFEKRKELLTATWVTFRISALALLLATIIGLAISLFLALSKYLYRAFFPYTIILQTTPIIAIAPVIIVWFGIGMPAMVTIAVIMSVFPIIASTTTGLFSTDSSLIQLFQLYNASPWQLLSKLRLPYALPYFFSGLRIAAGLSVIGTIIGEYVAGMSTMRGGLGYFILVAYNYLQTAEIFAATILSITLGIFFLLMINCFSYLVLRRWHASAIRIE